MRANSIFKSEFVSTNCSFFTISDSKSILVLDSSYLVFENSTLVDYSKVLFFSFTRISSFLVSSNYYSFTFRDFLKAFSFYFNSVTSLVEVSIVFLLFYKLPFTNSNWASVSKSLDESCFVFYYSYLIVFLLNSLSFLYYLVISYRVFSFEIIYFSWVFSRTIFCSLTDLSSFIISLYLSRIGLNSSSSALKVFISCWKSLNSY